MSVPAKSRKPKAEHAAVTTSLDGWKKRSVLHGVTLPSGMVVDLKQLSLETHLTYGRTPDALRVVAVADLRAKLRNEDIGQVERSTALQEYVDHQRNLIVEMLAPTFPDMTIDDLSDVPEQDIEMLIAIANRSTDEDAAGRALGFEPLNKWALFRDFHGCADDCEACRTLRDTLSTAVA